MSTLHVQGGIQFRPDLYRSPDRAAWFRAMGDELAARKLTITLAPGVEVKNGDEAVALFKRFVADKAGLSTAIGLPAGATLEGYFGDLVHAMDDTVKSTTTVKDQKLDFGPTSEMSKALGLDSKARYATRTTPFGASPPAGTMSVLGVRLSRTAPAPDPMAGKTFMSATTFANMPSYQWARDSVEMEKVMGVTGVDAHALLDALRSKNDAGRTVFQRLRKPELSEAYTVGYAGVGVEDMKWDGDSHRMREANKYVSLVIEGGRFEPDPATGERKISVGTDKMDDTYYDTPDFKLQDNDHSVRARARWDSDTEIRRLLVQVKANTTVDDNGVKSAAKVDVRNDSAKPEDIAGLDEAVRSGKTKWNGREEPVKPMKGLYETLASRGALADVGEHKGVLELVPHLRMRSVRSRYHLNESPLNAMQQLYKDTSTPRLQSALDTITAARAAGRVSAADEPKVAALEADLKGLLDGTLVQKRAEEGLKKLDPAMVVDAAAVQKLMPDLARSGWGGGGASSQLMVDQKKVVADVLDAAFHDVGTRLRDLRGVLAGRADTAGATPEMFRAWAVQGEPALAVKRTMDTFLARHTALAGKADAELQVDVDAFNAFGKAQKDAGERTFRDFKPLDLAAFRNLRAPLTESVLQTGGRMLEAAGSTAQALWFDEARSFYVPQSTRNTGNFLIDTTDMSEFIKEKDWQSIPADQRAPKDEIPKDKIFHVTLVNETQIELGLEKPYLDRINALKRDIKTDKASLVMKWMDAQMPGSVNAADGASYHAALKALLAGPPEALATALQNLGTFMAEQKSALAAPTGEALAALPADLFTDATKGKPVRTDNGTERALAGAQFVFDQYMDVQATVVKSKEERVMKTLKDAGLQGATWAFRETSKGDEGLALIRKGG